MGLTTGTRPAGRPNLRFKDVCKRDLKAGSIKPCRLGSCRDRGHRRLAVKAGTAASEERREEQWDERRDRRRLRAASIPTEPNMEGLLFQNRTVEPQQALQLSQWLNLGADFVISRDRRMPTALWWGRTGRRTDGQVPNFLRYGLLLARYSSVLGAPL